MTNESDGDALPHHDELPTGQGDLAQKDPLLTILTMENSDLLSEMSDSYEDAMDGIPDDGIEPSTEAGPGGKKDPGVENEDNWILEFKAGVQKDDKSPGKKTEKKMGKIKSLKVMKNGNTIQEKSGKPETQEIKFAFGNKDQCTDETKFFEPTGSAEQQKLFFLENQSYFKCSSCKTTLRSNGLANNTLRLVCKGKQCGRSTSFRLALEEIRGRILQAKPELLTATGEKREPPQSPTRNARKVLILSRRKSIPSDDEEMVVQQEELAAGTLARPHLDLQARMQTMLLENAALKKQNSSLIEENKLLKAQVEAMKTHHTGLMKKTKDLETALRTHKGKPMEATIKDQEWTEVKPKRSNHPSAPVKCSYAAVAASMELKQVVTKVGPKPTQSPTPPAVRKLAAEELSRVFQGMAPRAPRPINAVYATGIRAQKVSRLKGILKDQCGVTLRNVLNIDFIGKSVTEFHVFSDYVPRFKELVGACSTIHFLDIDPLDTALLRNPAVEDKTARAAAMYAQRLERRLQNSPSASHKRFLRTELARAKAVSIPSDPAPMEISNAQ